MAGARRFGKARVFADGKEVFVKRYSFLQSASTHTPEFLLRPRISFQHH